MLVEQDNWSYFDIELDAGDFLGSSNETADYKVGGLSCHSFDGSWHQ